MADPLPELRSRLAALDHAPVATHADVLEEVHRALVGQLDALASGAARAAAGSAGVPTTQPAGPR